MKAKSWNVFRKGSNRSRTGKTSIRKEPEMHSSQAHRNRKFYTGLPLDANSNEDGRSLTSKRRRFFRGISKTARDIRK